MPWERPGDKFGTSQGHPGRLGRFMWKFTFKGQKDDGTDDGTDGTCPRDRWDTNQGVTRQNSLCLLVFSFPNNRLANPRTGKGGHHRSYWHETKFTKSLRGIALAVMLASWPTSQWISAASAQIAVKTHRVAKLIFRDAHRTA